MKKIIYLFPVLFIALGFTFTRMTDNKIKNILDQIQYSEDGAKNMIFSNCSGAYFSYPNPKQLKNIAAGDKAALVKDVARYVKDYTKSREFLDRYMEYKNTRKPSPPEKPKSTAEMKEDQRNALKQGIENLQKTKLQMPKEQQAQFDETIKNFKEQLKEIDNPDNPTFNSQMENYLKQGYEQQMSAYNGQLAEWEKEYPDNPSPMIKKWLNKFLEESRDVDFSAELAEAKGGVKVFVKQAYEDKSDLWKLCFRAGKETTNAARSFAEEWLKELK